MNAPEAHRHAASRGPLSFAVLTVSDSRNASDDASGDAAVALVAAAGHRVVRRALVKDEREAIRAAALAALDVDGVDVLVTTGGTGLSPRDVTPEALDGLFEKRLPGFGEAFRRLSFDAIGPAAHLTRAEAGLSRGKLVYVLPGSPDAVTLALSRIVLPEIAHAAHVARRRAH